MPIAIKIMYSFVKFILIAFIQFAAFAAFAWEINPDMELQNSQEVLYGKVEHLVKSKNSPALWTITFLAENSYKGKLQPGKYSFQSATCNANCGIVPLGYDYNWPSGLELGKKYIIFIRDSKAIEPLSYGKMIEPENAPAELKGWLGMTKP